MGKPSVRRPIWRLPKIGIYVGSSSNHYFSNKFCRATSTTRKSKFETIACSNAGKIGNVIFIASQAGFSGLLRIYEFEVFTTTLPAGITEPQDITYRGTPSQSSVKKDLKAKNAVDGILESYCETDESGAKPYFQLSFVNTYKVIYIDITYDSPYNGYDILKFYVGNFAFFPSANIYCNSTIDKRGLNWETVTCENGGIEGKKFLITSDGIIKVREIEE